MAERYNGNCPGSVNRDAKYSVVYDPGQPNEMKIRLIYSVGPRTRELLSTSEHGDLVRMVNAVKEEVTGTKGGQFYISEYGKVVVPAGGEYYYAGRYDRYLEFDYEGRKIGPVPAKDLAPGDEWKGPHVGIPYVLCAGGKDIKYEVKSGNTVRTVLLSDECPAAGVAKLARRLAAVKGNFGGRVYINEAREFFAPISNGQTVSYIYLGPLGFDPWFRE